MVWFAAGLMGLLLVVATVVVSLRAMRAEGYARALSLAKSEPRLVDDTANFFGLHSKGMGQVRGNGCLIATLEELVFAQWSPKQALCVRRDRILGVRTPRAHLGKSKGGKLLQVHFATDHGVDSVAWAVSDLEAWLRELSAHPRLPDTGDVTEEVERLGMSGAFARGREPGA